MERRAIGMSLGLHGIILILMCFNFSFTREYSKSPAVIMHVDLNKVQIADKTNLPQKLINKKAQKVVPPKEEKKSEPQVKPVKKVSPVVEKKTEPKPQPMPVPKEAVPVQQTQPKKEEPKKEEENHSDLTSEQSLVLKFIKWLMKVFNIE